MTGPQQLALVGVFQGVFLMVVALRRRHDSGNIELAIVTALLTSRLVLSAFFGLNLPQPHPIVRLSLVSLFLVGPILRRYVRLLRGGTDCNGWWMHALPAGLALAVLFFCDSANVFATVGYLLYPHMTAYIIATAIGVWRFGQTAQDQVSTISLPGIHRATYVLSAMAIVMVLSAAGDLLLRLGREPVWYPWVPISTVVMLLFTASYLASERPNAGGRVDSVQSGNKKYAKNRLGEAVERRMLSGIETALETDELYTAMDLNLSDLAAAAGLPPQTVSMLLNLHRGENFYRFVNRRRVQAVIERMDNPENRDRSLIELAMACGFRSRSTFHTVFREITGHTPSHYRAMRSRATKP